MSIHKCCMPVITKSKIMKKINLFILFLFLFSISNDTHGQTYNLDKSLKGFDKYIVQIMKEWNSPGIAVGIIIKDKLEYSRGFGYRDLENNLLITSKTLFPIGSNTKLFTSVAMGMLVEEGKLVWDEPISNYIPQIKFYNQELNNTVTLRDMLAHRTGILPNFYIWSGSDFSRKELFDRLIYLKPIQPIRQSSLYNNMMYAAAGYCLELIMGKTWENFVQENIFNPLNMNSTLFTIEEMEVQEDFAYPYYEDIETDKLIKRPYYLERETKGIGPAAAIISNIDDMSKWVITLMNQGNYKGINVISSDILKETLQPAMADPNTALETEGYDEILNWVWGMGRKFAAYKGHYFTSHGGTLGGFHSQVSMMPFDSIGVLVLVNGAHNNPLPYIISYNIYDRLFGLEPTDFNSRNLKRRSEADKARKEGVQSTISDQIANTKPSHLLTDYQGQYENPEYGILNIRLDGEQLMFDFHHVVLPLEHYHYDRFDTSVDQFHGKYSVNFSMNYQGDIYKADMALGGLEVSLIRKPDDSLSDHNTLIKYVGNYEFDDAIIGIILSDEGVLIAKMPGGINFKLIPYSPFKFTIKQFPALTIEFVMDGNEVKVLKLIGPDITAEYKIK